MRHAELDREADRLPDGRTYNTCPSAGICAQVCYARHDTYRWPQVKAKHQANLRFVLDDPAGWEQTMLAELGAHRFRGTWIRIHDSGDFFSDAYLERWLRIIRNRPETTFYAYTKEVAPYWIAEEGDLQDTLRRKRLSPPRRESIEIRLAEVQSVTAQFANREVPTDAGIRRDRNETW